MDRENSRERQIRTVVGTQGRAWQDEGVRPMEGPAEGYKRGRRER